MHRGDVDLVLNLCLCEPILREQVVELFDGAFWVGVTCEVGELVRRETVRGDRYVGFASCSSAVVHDLMHLDLVIEATSTSPKDLALEVFEAVPRR